RPRLYAVARFAGSNCISICFLGLAPQALRCRPLRGLELYFYLFPGARAPGFTLSPASRARIVFLFVSWGLRPRLYAVARFAGFAVIAFASFVARFAGLVNREL